MMGSDGNFPGISLQTPRYKTSKHHVNISKLISREKENYDGPHIAISSHNWLRNRDSYGLGSALHSPIVTKVKIEEILELRFGRKMYTNEKLNITT